MLLNVQPMLLSGLLLIKHSRGFLFQVKFLEDLNLPTHWVCNMASRAPAILGRDPQSELQPVLDYIKGQGISGSPLACDVKAACGECWPYCN